MKKARALTKEQFDYVISEFIKRRDFRIASLIYLNSRPMRIHDVLNLRIEDVYDIDGAPRAEVFIKEQKTGHNRTLLIWTNDDSEIYQCLSKFYAMSLSHCKRSDFLFVNAKRKTKLTQGGLWFLLNQFIGEMKIDQISSHSIRKTTGRYLWSKGYEIETIAEIYQHDDIRSTRTYLDISQEEVRKAQEAICW